MSEIPWNGPSVVVPAGAVEVLRKFNQNFNYIELGLCRDCNGYYKNECQALSFESFWVEADGFCAWFTPREKPCQKSDEPPRKITEKQKRFIAAQAAKVRAKYAGK